jgi:Zn-dependent protease with chaperone function
MRGPRYESPVPSATWPIEEVWARPALTLALAALTPFVTARLLAALTLPPRLPLDPADAARAVAPFRAGAAIVGFVQIQMAWTLGATALGPAWVASPDGVGSALFATLAAMITFVMGAPARLVESAGARAGGGARPKALGQIALRLRAVPWLVGPVLAASACAWLPMIGPHGEVRVLVVLLAAALTFVGVAYAGPLLSVMTAALRPASPEIRAMARRAAQREGVSLLAVLRLPTHGVHFANAAALPWARTMIVTDHITELLDTEELDAVLAHEAGHLSEPPWVGLCRLGTVSALLFVTTSGAVVAEALAPGSSTLVLVIAVLVAIPMLRALLGLARRMEERADERARTTVSADALADALTKLARDSRAPLVTGRKHARLHPDLFDRICACGRDLGPRPAPPRRGAGLAAGLVIAAGLIAIPYGADAASRIDPDTVATLGPTAATWRLRIDPWDPTAMLALAWASARDHDPSLATARLTEARRHGARESDAMELDAELLAAAGHCVEGRARFEAALAQRASERFEVGSWEPLELGGYHLPPSLVTECGYGD